MLILVVIISALSSLHLTDAQCTFPSDLTGTWESPTKGNLTFNTTNVDGYEIFTGTQDVEMTFECHLNSGNYYVIRSENFTVLGGINVVNAVTCMDLTQQSSTKYSYYLKTPILADARSERVMFIAHDATVTLNDVCNETATTQEIHLLISYGNAVASAAQCPDAILGTYYYYNHGTCNSSVWDVCSDLTKMEFNYTQCSDVMAFSTAGVVYCLYSVYDGSTAIFYVYNTDATVDNSATYQYTCLMAEINSDGYIYTSMYPLECLPNMTTTYVASGGKLQVLAANITCVPTTAEEEATANAGLIAGLVILFLVLIVGGAVAGWFIYTKKFKKVSPNVIDSKEKSGLNSGRSIDPVTPSVVDPEFKSQPEGSHGKRYNKRIAIKKVNRRDICTPPVDTRSRVRYKRFDKDELTLITPRTLKPLSSPRQLLSSSISPLPPLSHRRISSVDNGPKVAEAPKKMQLELPEQVTRESTAISVISRVSTVREESIGLRLLSENSILEEKRSARRNVKSVQSSISERKVDVVKVKPPSRKARRSISLTVKPLKKANGTSSKNPRAMAEFKDTNVVYRRKKVRLVGKRQTHKKVKLGDINMKSVTKDVQDTRPASKESMFSFDLVKELKRPQNQLKLSINDRKSSVNNIAKPEPLPKPTETVNDDGDSNFFMCSNYEDDIDELGPFTNLTDSLKLSKGREVTNIKSIVESRKKPATTNKTAKEKPINTSKWDVVREVERVAKTSFIKSKTARANTNVLLKAKKEAVIEQKVLSRIYYNYDFKTKSKIRQRKRRNRRTVDLSKMTNFERIPTLINWVEYTDILATPAMAMQKQISTQNEKEKPSVEIANQKYAI